MVAEAELDRLVRDIGRDVVHPDRVATLREQLSEAGALERVIARMRERLRAGEAGAAYVLGHLFAHGVPAELRARAAAVLVEPATGADDAAARLAALALLDAFHLLPDERLAAALSTDEAPAAMRAIERRGCGEALVAALWRRLRDGEPMSHRLAQALPNLPVNAGAAAFLARRIRGWRAPGRRAAALLVGRLSDLPGALPLLLRAAGDRDAGVRQEAVIGLGGRARESSEARVRLLRALDDADERVRLGALGALSSLRLTGDELAALAPQFESPDEQVRRRAAEVLLEAELGRFELTPAMRRALAIARGGVLAESASGRLAATIRCTENRSSHMEHEERYEVEVWEQRTGARVALFHYQLLADAAGTRGSDPEAVEFVGEARLLVRLRGGGRDEREL